MPQRKSNYILIIAVLAFTTMVAGGCTRPYRDQMREREFAAIESYFNSQKLTVWQSNDYRYAPVRLGDSLNVQNGDILELYYAFFALSGGKLDLLATNNDTVAQSYQQPIETQDDRPLRIEIGKTQLMKGFELGLKNYAQLNGVGWPGIPSDLAYGNSRFGRVAPNTPILCQIYIVSASSERVERN